MRWVLCVALLLAPPVCAKRVAVQPEPDLPVPPIPPANPPPDDGAPRPNPNATAPDRPVQTKGVTLLPGIFKDKTRSLSDGYLGNSDSDTERVDRERPVTGLKLSVPIR